MVYCWKRPNVGGGWVRILWLVCGFWGGFFGHFECGVCCSVVGCLFFFLSSFCCLQIEQEEQLEEMTCCSRWIARQTVCIKWTPLSQDIPYPPTPPTPLRHAAHLSVINTHLFDASENQPYSLCIDDLQHWQRVELKLCIIQSGHLKDLAISALHQQKDRWRLGWGSLVFLRVLFRSPGEGGRVEEEAGFSFYLFCELYIGCWFPLCNIVQVICIDWENAFYTVFHNKVLNVHTDVFCVLAGTLSSFCCFHILS